jgi:hypothetical protein
MPTGVLCRECSRRGTKLNTDLHAVPRITMSENVYPPLPISTPSQAWRVKTLALNNKVLIYINFIRSWLQLALIFKPRQGFE